MCRSKLKKLLAIEAERAAAITQWRKKVIIDKQVPANEHDPLVSRNHRFLYLRLK